MQARFHGALRRSPLNVFATRKSVEDLRNQLDFFKSSLEVTPELIADWERWRVNNPVPKQPLVSVCVATYNRAELLIARSIPSVLAQSYRNLELIVVGDGCTDGTEAALSAIRDGRLRYENLSKRGTYPRDPIRRWMVAGTPAMNRALELAEGDFVTHLDDDDEYLPHRLEMLVEFALTRDCDFVWHPFWYQTSRERWKLNNARSFDIGSVTTSSVFYRSWFANIAWDIEAHRLMEPGDWNRLRRIRYINPVSMRCPEPLLRHYREQNQTIV
jgi:glycosyltransferase involved in cell wall biosynthesis